MGENVLESQAKNTQKRRQRRTTEHKQRRLFERPERVTDEFIVDRLDVPCNAKVGDVLHCYPGSGKASVDVVHENKQIGTVGDGGGDVLQELSQGHGCVAAAITSVCDLTDSMTVRIKLD